MRFKAGDRVRVVRITPMASAIDYTHYIGTEWEVAKIAMSPFTAKSYYTFVGDHLSWYEEELEAATPEKLCVLR